MKLGLVLSVALTLLSFQAQASTRSDAYAMAIGQPVISLPATSKTSYGYRLTPSNAAEVLVIVPEHKNGRMFIWHAGHDQDSFASFEPLQPILKAGYTLVLMVMPQRPHELRMAESPEAPLRPFLAPVIEILNWAEANGYKNITISGLSGGGWTATLIAALDERITASFPVAGSMPLYLHGKGKRERDGEQTWAAFYNSFPYETLYGLATSQIQILNECETLFPGSIAKNADYSNNCGPNFSLHIVKDSHDHSLTPQAVAFMLQKIK